MTADDLPAGRGEGPGGPVDVRHDRPPLRPREPAHDVPHGRRLAAHARWPGSTCRPASRCSTWPAAPATSAASWPAPASGPIGVDLSFGMLAAARTDAPRSSTPTRCGCPVPDGSVDGVTCGFALRNFVDLGAFFAELARVVRPGGRIALLEVAEPPNPVLRWGHGVYFGKVVPRIGGAAVRRRRLPLPAEVGRLPARARA